MPVPLPAGLLALAALLTGCAGAGLKPAAAPTPPQAPSAWHAPAVTPAAATAGAASRAEALQRWWSRFGDPALATVVSAAQDASPSVSAAASRIAQARAARVSAQADLGVSVGLQAAASRTRTSPQAPVVDALGLGVLAAWEADLFGALASSASAAQARLGAAEAGWHDAHLSVAAEAGAMYGQLRACEALADVTVLDSRSREETARLTSAAARAGLRASADAALAQAVAAQGRLQAVQQQAQCDRLVKALVALTALDEAALRKTLAAGRSRVPDALPPEVLALPGELLRQRPDLARAEREAIAALAEVRAREAAALPRIAISGQLGVGRVASAGLSSDGATWSIGPLSVTWPLLDGGRREAATAAARAAHDDAARQWAAALRQAVREVEDALVRIDSVRRRGDDVVRAAEEFQTVLRVTEARWKGGLASSFELEEARRSALAAQAVRLDWQRERLDAAIALYRALGGGWDETAPTPPMTPASPATPAPLAAKTPARP